MAARGAAAERMVAMEAASGFGRIGLAQGLGALHAAVLPQAPPLLGVVPVQWERVLSGSTVPAFLSGMVAAAAHVKRACGWDASGRCKRGGETYCMSVCGSLMRVLFCTAEIQYTVVWIWLRLYVNHMCTCIGSFYSAAKGLSFTQQRNNFHQPWPLAA